MISWRTGGYQIKKKAKKFLNDFLTRKWISRILGLLTPRKKQKGFQILATITVHELKTVDNIFLHRKKNEDDF